MEHHIRRKQLACQTESEYPDFFHRIDFRTRLGYQIGLRRRTCATAPWIRTTRGLLCAVAIFLPFRSGGIRWCKPEQADGCVRPLAFFLRTLRRFKRETA